MDRRHVRFFISWFDAYAASFETADPEFNRNIILKSRHTRRVCGEIFGLGRALGLSDEDRRLSVVTALFHDLGRFEQYRRFGTFSDRKSVNHAELGVEILRREGVLDGLDESVTGLITDAVRYHNRAALPDHLDPRHLFFTRLLRDADKLDILRVVTAYYAAKTRGEHNETIELDLPDTPGVSAAICEQLINGQTIRFEDMNNLNDFKLLQVGWVYDINFVPALKRLQRRAYLAMLRSVLPDSDDIRRVFGAVKGRLEERLKEGA
ncbi:HD domain-containing protein [Desulfatiferula olefinivorans]